MNALGWMPSQYFIAKITTCNSLENEAPLCGCRAILEGVVQPLQREELDLYGMKLPLLHPLIGDVSELGFSRGSVG